VVGPRVRLTLERAETRENRLGETVREWAPAGDVDVTLAPASAHMRTQAALRGTAATHVALLPAGTSLDPYATRLRGPDRALYRVVAVTDTPRGVLVELEATREPEG